MVQSKETDAQRKERERKEAEAQEVKEGGSKADYPKIERKSDVDAGVPEKFSTPFADPTIQGRPTQRESWAPEHTGVTNPPNPPMHNDTDIKSETNLDTLQRQLAESRAKAEELQKELQALKEPQPQYTMQPEVPKRQFFGPDEGPKAQPQPDPKDSGKGGKANMKPETWNEKTYVLLSDHHMSDRVLERGTLVGKGTPYPLTNRPSNAMEETDTPKPPAEERKLRHVEPQR